MKTQMAAKAMITMAAPTLLTEEVRNASSEFHSVLRKNCDDPASFVGAMMLHALASCAAATCSDARQEVKELLQAMVADVFSKASEVEPANKVLH